MRLLLKEASASLGHLGGSPCHLPFRSAPRTVTAPQHTHYFQASWLSDLRVVWSHNICGWICVVGREPCDGAGWMADPGRPGTSVSTSGSQKWAALKRLIWV